MKEFGKSNAVTVKWVSDDVVEHFDELPPGSIRWVGRLESTKVSQLQEQRATYSN